MDFLTQLSIRYTEKSAVLDEEDPEDAGKLRKNNYLINPIILAIIGVIYPFGFFTLLI